MISQTSNMNKKKNNDTDSSSESDSENDDEMDVHEYRKFLSILQLEVNQCSITLPNPVLLHTLDLIAPIQFLYVFQ